MTIPQIKAALPMRRLLAHHGLEPDRAGMLCCPFHDDRTPSMQCFDDSHTVRCYSANCPRHGQTIDVIDFAMYHGRLTKAQAIRKCKELIGRAPSSVPPAKPPKPAEPNDDLGRAAVLQKAFAYFTHAIAKSEAPQAYLASRGLDYRQLADRGLGVGYNSGQIHHGARRSEHLVRSLLDVGLLAEALTGRRSRTGEPAYRSFGKGCLTFALRGAGGNVAGMYFRRVERAGDTVKPHARHRYLPDRRGLYPRYPAPNTTHLLLAESVVDAASLLHDETTAPGWSVVALYGASNYTAEHAAAVAALPKLNEVCLLLDGDAAGRAATQQIAAKLRDAHPKLTVTATPTPDGQDANALLVAHGPTFLANLIEEREPVEGREPVATEEDAAGVRTVTEPPGATEPPQATDVAPGSEGLPPSTDRRRHVSAAGSAAVEAGAGAPRGVLDTSRPHDLALRADSAELRVKGLRRDQLDTLRLTLQIRIPQTSQP